MAWLKARDYSVYQGDVDFTREPIDIALIKMSGGDNGLYMDANANQNYERAIAAGKGVMGWHFAGGTDPVQEAQYAVRAMEPFAENDVYGIDWEVQHADPVGWVLSYITEFHTLTGAYPIPYLNGSTINAYDWSPVFNLVLPWVAWWGISPDDNVPIKSAYIIQQYDNSGTVVSNGLRVDEDAVFLTLEEFKAHGYHSQPTPPPVQADPTPAPSPAPTPTTDPTPQPSPGPQSSPSPSAPVENPDGSTTIPVTVKPKPVPVITGPSEIDNIEGDVKMVLGKYNKFLVAIAGTLVSFLAAHYGANPIVKDVIDVLTVLGVYQVPNVKE